MSKHRAIFVGATGAGVALVMLILPALCLSKPTALGMTYHVSVSTGNDDWPGTKAQPWKTLAKASSMTFRPGDKVLLKRGEKWNEALTFNGQGSAWGEGREVRLGAYGSGDRPRISLPDGTSLQMVDPNFAIVEDLDLYDERSSNVLLSVYYSTAGNQGLKLRNLTLHGGHLNTVPWKNTSIWINADPAIVQRSGKFVARDIELENIETFLTDPPGIDLAGAQDENDAFPWAAQDVIVRDSYFHDSTGAFSLRHVTNVTVMNNRLKGLGNVNVESGTTSIYVRYLRNARFFNNVISDVPAKATYPNNDETGMDLPPGNSGVQVMGNFFGRNAGAGFNFDPVPRAKDGYTGFTQVEQNVFKNNGLNPDRTKVSRGSILVAAWDDNNYRLTALVQRNLSCDPTGFLVYHPAASSPHARKTYIDCEGCLALHDNPVVGDARRLFHAGDDFAVDAGAAGAWSYEYSSDGTTWAPLAADPSRQRYGNDRTGFVDRFHMKPGSSAGCKVARVWTAPAGLAGPVAVTGWFFRSQKGNSDLRVVVVGPGNFRRTWGVTGMDPAAGAASWIEPDGKRTVAPGQQIRFELHHLSDGEPGELSWIPGVAILDQ